MSISELIEKLCKLRDEKGDVEVWFLQEIQEDTTISILKLKFQLKMMSQTKTVKSTKRQ